MGIHRSNISLLKAIANLIRVHQWTKNLLILVPQIMAHKIFDIDLLLKNLLVVISFSFLASIVYVINDIKDLENDKLQEYKKTRPIASGLISKKMYLTTLLLLIIAELLLVTQLEYSVVELFLGYLFLNLFYTFYLKRIELVDLICLTVFYLFRIFIGGKSVDIPISFWLIFFSSFLFFSLSVLKRVSEILTNRINLSNSNSRGYIDLDLNFLSNLGMISSFASVIVLGLYINDETVSILYQSPDILWLTIPTVIYMLSKLWLETFRGKMHYDPLIYLIKEKELVFSIAVLLGIIAVSSVGLA
jgi:4-hydroxybenzoate polyprenyltransferase